MNSKEDNAKKDLRLAYSQGNKLSYPVNVESMARYLLMMYNIKNVNNPCDKKGDKNRKKDDEPKSEDKDNNNTGTTGAHAGETTMPQDSGAPSNGSSIGAHIYIMVCDHPCPFRLRYLPTRLNRRCVVSSVKILQYSHCH